MFEIQAKKKPVTPKGVVHIANVILGFPGLVSNTVLHPAELFNH